MNREVRFSGIDCLAYIYLIFAIFPVYALIFYHKISPAIIFGTPLCYSISHLLFKRNGSAISAIYFISFISVLVAIIPLGCFIADLFMSHKIDYSILLLTIIPVLFAIGQMYYISRPQIKDQFDLSSYSDFFTVTVAKKRLSFVTLLLLSIALLIAVYSSVTLFFNNIENMGRFIPFDKLNFIKLPEPLIQIFLVILAGGFFFFIILALVQYYSGYSKSLLPTKRELKLALITFIGFILVTSMFCLWYTWMHKR